MHIGQLLMADTTLYTPWFPREADNATFTYEQIKISNAVTLTIKVFHKNTSVPGPGSELTGDVGGWISDGNLRYREFMAIEEMVRFQVSVSSEVGSATGVGNFDYPAGAYPAEDLQIVDVNDISFIAIGFAIYRLLAPTWYDTARYIP